MHVDFYKRLLEADRKVHRFFTANSLPGVHGVLALSTHAGAGAPWIAAYAFFLIFFRDHFTQLIYVIVLAEVAALPVVILLRYMTKRERPAISHNSFFLTPWNRYSFPSHHALRAFIILVAVGTAFPAFLPILIAMAATISFSRIVLAKHYLSDVLAGALLGTVLALVSQNLNRMWL